MVQNNHLEEVECMTVYEAYPNLYREQKVNQLLIIVLFFLIGILIGQKIKTKKMNKVLIILTILLLLIIVVTFQMWHLKWVY